MQKQHKLSVLLSTLNMHLPTSNILVSILLLRILLFPEMFQNTVPCFLASTLIIKTVERNKF